MDLVLRFAQRVIVLAAGAVIFDGSPEAVVADPQVRAAYLGTYGVARRLA
jgi:branched-chain amino acid transport system ATP-binding protein